MQYAAALVSAKLKATLSRRVSEVDREGNRKSARNRPTATATLARKVEGDPLMRYLYGLTGLSRNRSPLLLGVVLGHPRRVVPYIFNENL